MKLLFLFLLATAISLVSIDAQTFPGIGNQQTWLAAAQYNNRGADLAGHGKFLEAIANFNQAIAIYPYDAEFYGNLGLAKEKTQDIKGAETEFDTAIKVNPKDWAPWNYLGVLLHMEKRLQDSRDALTQALKFNPPATDEAQIQNNIRAIDRELNSRNQ